MLARLPIRVRLALWYSLLLALILAAFAAGVYLLLRQSLYSSLDDSLESRATTLLSVIQHDSDRPFLRVEESSQAPGREDVFTRVFDASGNISFDDSAAIGHMPVNRSVTSDALAGRSNTRGARPIEDDDGMRVLIVPIIHDGAVRGALEVGQADDASETLATLLLIIGITYPVTLAIASFGGLFLAGRALSPIDSITRTARDISAEDLGRRLDLRLPDDEVGRLARTFDDMIARLEDAFRRQRQFTADASHELRTPLTVIKGQIDVSLQKARQPDDYRQVLRSVNAEVDRLIRLSGSLLTLSRADAGQIPLTLEEVDLGDVVTGVVEHVRAPAGDKGVELRLDQAPSLKIRADQDLLIQLLLNLVENSVKYTNAEGRVTVGWRRNGSRVDLSVQDTGIGISGEHLPRIFDRFYRVDTARSRAEGGVGLGLAISRWIAEVHGGSIDVESTPGEGSTFTVSLPIQH